MRKNLWKLITLTLMVFGAVVAVFTQSRARDAVQTLAAKRGDIVEAVYGLGTVTASQSFQLKIGVTAAIRELMVREGEAVKRGQSLLRIDSGTLFRAPFDGTITSVPFKPGETVFPQLPIITETNLLDRYIVVSLEQEGALRVKAGQATRMSVESIRGQFFEGKVRTLFPGDNQFLVHIDVPRLPPEIIPGMTGDVAIEVARRHDVLMVPVSAVQSGRVVVRSGHRNRKVDVALGAVDGRWAEVTQGEIQAGDEIVVPAR